MVELGERKSKSQVKREMQALQALGEQLVELPVGQINKIAMPEELREAVLFAKSLKQHEARRRQLQYIGTLMREADPEPIRKALDEISRGQSLEAELFQELEQLRNGLVDGDESLLEKAFRRFPKADRQRLRQLAINARKERDGNKPPRSSRALFRYLKEVAGN